MAAPIYMDCHATTPVDPRVLEVMQPYFTHKFGNASSRNHAFGWEAEDAVTEARRQVAALIGADPREIIFTSGATESDNLAIKGAVTAERDHIVTTAVEHKAVLDACRALEEAGRARVTVVPVDSTGRVDPARVEEAITDRTALVSVLHANNEIGTIQDLEAIGRIVAERGALFHTDAAQSFGKVPIDVKAMHLHLVSISAHKIYGPKGVGALYVRRRRPHVRLAPLIDGGGHERGLRSGTLNVPGIVGLGKAAELCGAEMADEARRVGALRDRLQARIMLGLKDVFLNGHPQHRLPGNLNLSFAYVETERLLLALDGVAVSSGAACMSASLEPSYVLRAIGVPGDLAARSIRFGLGRFNTQAEVDAVAERVVAAAARLREGSPAALAGCEPASVAQRRASEESR
jgi:cysteine desulfurase